LTLCLEVGAREYQIALASQLINLSVLRMAARLMGRRAVCDWSRESESEQREHDSDRDESDLHSHIQSSSVLTRFAGLASAKAKA
jgi:hypothetical protein